MRKSRLCCLILSLILLIAFGMSCRPADSDLAESYGSVETGISGGEGTLPEILGAESSFRQNSFLTAEGAELRYWLYIPEAPTEQMPLIVYLHGGSGKGNDLGVLTENDGFPQYLCNGILGNVRAYVVIPQLSDAYKGWSDIKVSLRELIGYVTDTCSVDAARISLTGHSMGGRGTYDIALAYPGLFSRIAPLSGSVTVNEKSIGVFSKLQIRAFVGNDDTIVSPQSTVDLINALNKLHSDARLTAFENAGHFDVPAKAYLETDLLDWLMWR